MAVEGLSYSGRVEVEHPLVNGINKKYIIGEEGGTLMASFIRRGKTRRIPNLEET